MDEKALIKRKVVHAPGDEGYRVVDESDAATELLLKVTARLGQALKEEFESIVVNGEPHMREQRRKQ